MLQCRAVPFPLTGNGPAYLSSCCHSINLTSVLTLPDFSNQTLCPFPLDIAKTFEEQICRGPYIPCRFVLTLELSGFQLDDPNGFEIFAAKRGRHGDNDPYLTVCRLRWMHMRAEEPGGADGGCALASGGGGGEFAGQCAT